MNRPLGPPVRRPMGSPPIPSSPPPAPTNHASLRPTPTIKEKESIARSTSDTNIKQAAASNLICYRKFTKKAQKRNTKKR